MKLTRNIKTMNIHELIYRKQLIEITLNSGGRSKENISTIFRMVNKDRKFLHSCVRAFRGNCSITKRIERIRSGNKLY